MFQRASRWLCVLALALLLNQLPAAAQKFGASNLIVAYTNLDSHNPAHTNHMFEYTRGGALVQQMDIPTGDPAGGGFLRGVTVDTKNRVSFFNGTFSPYLSTYDSVHGGWTQTSIAGWSMVNNLNYGGIASYGPYLFLPDFATAYDGSPNGIIRYNANTGASERFSPIDYIDATMGNDGMLYVRAYDDGYGTPFHVFDPHSLAPGRVFHTNGVNSIVVSHEGEIYGISGTQIVHLHSDGTLAGSLTIGHNPYNIAISSDRKIAVSCADGWVALTDESFSHLTGFQAYTRPESETWIAWVAFVPNSGALHHAQDFDGDGKADLLFQNQTNGGLATWFANGQNILGAASLKTQVGAGYHAVGVDDFNGDDKPDVVFQNDAARQVTIWYMDGTAYTGGASISKFSAVGDHVVAVGDFDGDGKPDIVFQNESTGVLTLWYMNGTTFLRSAVVAQVPFTGYKVVGAGDFNGDGKRDLVFQNATSGQVVLWYMNGNVFQSGVSVPYVPGSQWQVKNVADFDGDDRPDIAFQNKTTGQIVLWYMNLAAVTGGGQTTLTPLSDYKLAGPP